MRPKNHYNRRRQILEVLAEYPDGLTRSAIQRQLAVDSDAFANAVKRLPNVYIDRWQAKSYRMSNGGHRIMWVAVYCMVDTPPDAPKPDRPPTEDDMMAD
jgi:hypothetical protein